LCPIRHLIPDVVIWNTNRFKIIFNQTTIFLFFFSHFCLCISETIFKIGIHIYIIYNYQLLISYSSKLILQSSLYIISIYIFLIKLYQKLVVIIFSCIKGIIKNILKRFFILYSKRRNMFSLSWFWPQSQTFLTSMLYHSF